MTGAYCRFCDHRCFVLRVIPDGPRKGWSGHLATCARGMEHDRQQTGGYDHTNTINLADDQPGHPFAAIFAGAVDTRRPNTDGGPTVTEFLRSKGEL